MEKREVILDLKLGVPLCYVKFFSSKGQDQEPHPKPNEKKHPISNPELPTITIQTAKEKNKDCTIAAFPSSIKLSDNDLKKFTNHLQKVFHSGASFKKNPLKINLSGTKPDEFKEEIQTFFKLENVTFKIIEKKINVKDEFQVYIMPIDNGVEVSWKQRSSPRNLENDFQKLVEETWEVPINNKSTHKEAKFTITGISADTIQDYFLNKYVMQPKQIVIINSVHNEPSYNQELMLNYPKPLSLIEKFNINKKNYFSEISSAILDLLAYQQDRYKKKVFNCNLNFTRIGPDKKGKIKWTTIINPRKIFSKSQIINGHVLNLGDKVIITYHDDTFYGYINEIDQETAKITARFLFSSSEKPPGFDGEVSDTNNDDSSEYDNDEEEDNNDKEKEEYERFLKEKDYVIVDNEKDEEEVDKDKEEQRINELVAQAQEILNDDKNEEEEEDENDANYTEDQNAPYSVYFEKSEAFFEKSARALLYLYDSHSEIRDAITKSGRYDDQNKTDKNISLKNASVNLTDSIFLTDQQKKDPDFMKKLQITPSREQKKSIEMVLSNKISIVHGPPGTGKTFSLALYVYHILSKLKEDEKHRILLCAKNDEDVSHIVKFVSPIVHALGKKIVWVSYQTFDNVKQFNNATDEEKELISYQIMNRKTAEAEIYQSIQKEIWGYNEKVRMAMRNQVSEIPKFPSKKLTKMNELRGLIETNLVHESDVVCCTISASAKYNISDKIFNSIFIDDAQQANQIVSIIPLVHGPNRLVLLGDSKQLKSFTNSKIKKNHHNATKSLYKRLMKKRVPSQYLNYQYRMHPSILAFPNNQFYLGTIQSDSNVESNNAIDLPFIQTPIIFVDVHDGKEIMKKNDKSFIINNHECYTVQKIVSDLKICQISGKEIGVMTPYFSQANKINHILSSLRYKGLKVSTIENFQGDERDFIILSLVRTKDNDIEFKPDESVLNVALTRAKKGMIIVGNFDLFANLKGENCKHMVDLCKFYKDCESVINDDQIEVLKHLVQKPVKKPLIIMKPKNTNQNDDKEEEEKKDDGFDYDDDDDNEGKNDIDKIDDLLNGNNPSDEDDDDDNFEYDDDSSYDANENDFDDDDFDFDNN